MRKNWALLKCFLSEQIEYRVRLFLWGIIELVAAASGIFLWLAVYRDQAEVSGYNANQMVFYYALIPLIGSITYTYVASRLSKEIKNGTISLKLLKPHDLTGENFIRVVSIKAIQLLFKAPVFVGLIILLAFLFGLDLKASQIILALSFSLFAFLLHFFLDLCLSLAAFWFHDIWAFDHLRWVAIMIFGGVIFPLDLVPEAYRAIFNFLPFRFIYFLPIKIAQGRIDFSQILYQWMQLMVWLLFFFYLSKILWRKGLRKYEAYGN